MSPKTLYKKGLVNYDVPHISNMTPLKKCDNKAYCTSVKCAGIKPKMVTKGYLSGQPDLCPDCSNYLIYKKPIEKKWMEIENENRRNRI